MYFLFKTKKSHNSYVEMPLVNNFSDTTCTAGNLSFRKQVKTYLGPRLWKKKKSHPMCGEPFESAHYFVTIRLKVDENKIGNITNEVWSI